ncbi:15288_t:CDS:2 [Funneliformis caledonium]|uniref:15288_t:CDS:1 n=1 Tax=Funneliformis caledonium TaxID=1117310 RepID=A0A9N9E3M9_9GLOM|nr:15288_t:CDS:2 [Funneliformis caledonium]
MHVERIKRLKEYYGQDLHHIKLIYNQEVLKTEIINTVRRRAKEIVVTKYKDIQIEKRNKGKGHKVSSKKQIYRMSSKEAIQILLPMVKYPNPPIDKGIQNYLDVLAENIPSSNIWDKH